MAGRDQSFSGRRSRASGGGTSPADVAGHTASAREIVARRAAEQAAAYPDLAITPLNTAGLDDRDAGLAHAIYDAVIRRWLTLGFAINLYTRQPVHELEPAMQGVLLSGAAQLLFFDRLPAHAVLNESVEIAKRLVRPGAAGMVNAVLRRVAELAGTPATHEARQSDWPQRRDVLPMGDGRVLVLRGEVLPADALQRLAISTSHPPGLVRRWASVHRREALQALLLHSLASPPTILNTAHADSPLPGGLIPHEVRGHHVFQGTRAELLALLESREDVWVQDAASSSAVAAAARVEPRPRLIVDACAGQGTKTRQLARTFTEARIIATDIDAQRRRTLADVFAGSAQVEVVAAGEVRGRAGGRADLVLLDVPCSNTGVLARRPEARYRAGRDQLERLRDVQRQILRDTGGLLHSSPRGRIVYSTCSIDREENEFQADWAAHELGLKLERHELQLPAGLPGEDPRGYQDGSFYAFLS